MSQAKKRICSELQELVPKLSMNRVREVIACYSEDWRKYHYIDHPVALLDVLIKIVHSLTVEELSKLKLMIIYHDVVYKLNRTSGWNEVQSALLMKRHLEGLFPDVFIKDVYTGIMATIKHNLEEVRPELRPVVALLIDIDLFVGLGATAAQFQSNTEKIRQEFRPVTTSDEFKAGRGNWAKGMLQRPCIYHTDHFAEFEAIALQELRKLAA